MVGLWRTGTEDFEGMVRRGSVWEVEKITETRKT